MARKNDATLDMWAIVPEGEGDLAKAVACFADEGDAEECRQLWYVTHCVVKVSVELELVLEDI